MPDKLHDLKKKAREEVEKRVREAINSAEKHQHATSTAYAGIMALYDALAPEPAAAPESPGVEAVKWPHPLEPIIPPVAAPGERERGFRDGLMAMRAAGWGPNPPRFDDLVGIGRAQEKRAEAAERERDEWKARHSMHLDDALRFEKRLAVAVDALKKLHGAGYSVLEGDGYQPAKALREIENLAGEGNNSGASGVTSAGSSPTSRPPQMVDNQSGTASPPTGKAPSPALSIPEELVKARTTTDDMKERSYQSSIYSIDERFLDAERSVTDRLLAEKDAEIERLTRFVELRVKFAPALEAAIKATDEELRGTACANWREAAEVALTAERAAWRAECIMLKDQWTLADAECSRAIDDLMTRREDVERLVAALKLVGLTPGVPQAAAKIVLEALESVGRGALFETQPPQDACEYCGRSDLGCQPGTCEARVHKVEGPSRAAKSVRAKPPGDSSEERA